MNALQLFVERRQQRPQPRLHISYQGVPAVLPHREDYLSRDPGWTSLRHSLTICLFANASDHAVLPLGVGCFSSWP